MYQIKTCRGRSSASYLYVGIVSIIEKRQNSRAIKKLKKNESRIERPRKVAHKSFILEKMQFCNETNDV